MTGRLRALVAAVWATLATACTYNANQLTPGEQAALVTWLECEECTDAELAAVRAIGPRVVSSLETAIRFGPSQRQRDVMSRKYSHVFDVVKSKLPSGPGTSTLTQQVYVDRARDNYVATYQKRAITALAAVGGLNALPRLQTLLTSATSNMRSDVMESLRLAVAKVDTAMFRGRISPRSPGFGDTVIIRPPAFEPFDGNETVSFEGSALSASEALLYATRDSLAILVAGLQGQHVLNIRNVGTTNRSQSTVFEIRTMLDRNDRNTVACGVAMDCLVSNAPRFTAVRRLFRVMLTQWNRGASFDTLDVLKFQPSTPLTIKATLDWPLDTANFNLNWIDCFTKLPVGNANGSTPNQRPETTTVTVLAGQCWVLKVSLSSGMIPLTYAKLVISP